MCSRLRRLADSGVATEASLPVNLRAPFGIRGFWLVLNFLTKGSNLFNVDVIQHCRFGHFSSPKAVVFLVHEEPSFGGSPILAITLGMLENASSPLLPLHHHSGSVLSSPPTLVLCRVVEDCRAPAGVQTGVDADYRVSM